MKIEIEIEFEKNEFKVMKVVDLSFVLFCLFSLQISLLVLMNSMCIKVINELNIVHFDNNLDM